jgi:hypothetical protein
LRRAHVADDGLARVCTPMRVSIGGRPARVQLVGDPSLTPAPRAPRAPRRGRGRRRERRAEDRHDRVADELVDHAALRQHRLAHAREVVVEERDQLLRGRLCSASDVNPAGR